MTSAVVCEVADEWDDIILDLGGHPLQLWGWGEVKSAHRWTATRVIFKDEETVIGAAQILWRKLPWPFRRLNYVPRGPVYTDGSKQVVYETLAAYVREHLPGTVLTVEPDDVGELDLQGWKASQNTILMPRTVILQLENTQETLLGAMAKKTRQYIRKSGREGVTIRQVASKEAVAECLEIYHQTAARAHFAIHGDQYYYDIQDKLGDSSIIFAAYDGGAIVSFVWLVISSSTAFELYGGMNDRGQELRANYALKWHSVTTCKRWGLERYDMNGLLNDGVSTFKQSFASHEDMLSGTFDYPLSPFYSAWTTLLPRVKAIVQRIKSLR